MSSPLVSILIPAYNAAPFIRATLQSALAQTWPNVEIIVVDDGSTDETASVVEAVADRRIRLIRQGRRGPSAAQNAALQHAQGRFIQRLDADDLLSPDKIARQMARLLDTPRALAAGQWARFVNDPAEARFRLTSTSRDLSPEAWFTRDCAIGLPMLQPGLWLTSREVVDAAGPWDERLTLNNDFDYGVRLLLASDRVLYCNEARLYYRSGNQASLASQRSAGAWQSTLLSMELGSSAMLARSAGEDTRRACANLFQPLAYTAHLDAPDVCAAAEAHVARLGGSSVPMDGGVLFRLVRDTLGWRRANQVKHAAYRVGYSRVARAKEHALREGLGL